MGPIMVWAISAAGVAVARSASIPAAVVSMAILRGLMRNGTILENNVVQTIASTAESLAAGIIFTVPALVLVGAWQDFAFWPTTFIAMLGGSLGVVFMVPLRRALIVNRPDLTYPEGVACSQVLITGQEGGSGIRTIAAGLGVGAIVKFLISGAGLVKGTVETATVMGKSVFYFGSDVSAALIGVGYIVNLRVASQVFLGGAIGWLVAIPILAGYETGASLDVAWALWDTNVRYMGVGAMLVGGLHSIWAVRSGIWGGVTSLMTPAGDSAAERVSRTERDIPFTALATMFVLTFFGVFALYEYLIDSHVAAAAATLTMVVAAFVFVAVATYIVGLVGSSNSPVSGMTICALLLTSAVMLALGIQGDTAILATLGVAGVVCCAVCTSGDIAQDLKTGVLVGATPARQQTVEFIGVLVPAFIFAPILTLLHNQYGIGQELRAPQAALFASLTQGFFGDGTLPLDMVVWGAAIAAGILAVDFALVRRALPFRLYVMPIAVGLYLPLALAVPILIGGILRAMVGRARNEEAQDGGLLFGSGLIAGEALMGIGIAAVAALPALADAMPLFPESTTDLASLATIGVVMAIFMHFARPDQR